MGEMELENRVDLCDVPLISQWDVQSKIVVPYNYKWTIENFALIAHGMFHQVIDQKSGTFNVAGLKCFLSMSIHHSFEVSSNVLKLELNTNAEDDSVLNIKQQNTVRCEPLFHCQLRAFLGSKPITVKNYNLSIKVGNNQHFASIINPDGSFLKKHIDLPLTVYCDMKFYLDAPVCCVLERKFCALRDQQLKLLMNLGNLLTNETMCDVTIICENREIGAHKIILAAQSPVFEAMFRNELKESVEGIVKSHFKYEVVSELLKFMYCGEIDSEKMATNSVDLLAAANYYEVTGLFTIFEELLMMKVDLENAERLHNIAKMMNAKKLERLTDNVLKLALKYHVPYFVESGNYKLVKRSKLSLLKSPFFYVPISMVLAASMVYVTMLYYDFSIFKKKPQVNEVILKSIPMVEKISHPTVADKPLEYLKNLCKIFMQK